MSIGDLATLEVVNLLDARSFPGPFPSNLAGSLVPCTKCKSTIEHSPGLCLAIRHIRKFRSRKKRVA